MSQTICEKETARYAVGRCYVSEILRPLADEWAQEANGSEFGLLTSPDELLKDVDELTKGPDSVVLLLLKNAEVAGLIGIVLLKNPVGQERIANEHYWYCLPECRSLKSALMMLEEAKKWAKLKGCSHFMMNASNLASSSHDKVCRLYERLGMKKFETTYICSLDAN
jgi:hypothetical protein